MDSPSPNETRQIVSSLDLTRLKVEDDETNMRNFLLEAKKQLKTLNSGKEDKQVIAAFCIFPRFISLAKKTLESDEALCSLPIATVANFPEGNDPITKVVEEIFTAKEAGAAEADVVLPYPQFLKEDVKYAEKLVSACSDACSDNMKLKVILETGKLETVDKIYSASRLAIDAGADYIKTSTGFCDINATLVAASTMLDAISDSKNLTCGFKASGGIHTLEQARDYLHLARTKMGHEWVTPDHFRIGSSRLLNDIISTCLN